VGSGGQDIKQPGFYVEPQWIKRTYARIRKELKTHKAI
jgi:hypothetical protein